jgi:hypothetical protein
MGGDYKVDKQFGVSNEYNLIEKINAFFRPKYDEEDIKNTKEIYNDEYFPYDFEGMTHKTSFELKSRRNRKDQYPTTLLASHKVRKTAKGKQIFIFTFTDYNTYIEYDEQLFSTFEQNVVYQNRLNKKDIPRLHYYIPVKYLSVF